MDSARSVIHRRGSQARVSARARIGADLNTRAAENCAGGMSASERRRARGGRTGDEHNRHGIIRPRATLAALTDPTLASHPADRPARGEENPHAPG